MSSQGTYFYLANTCGASPVPKMSRLCRGGEEMSIRQCPCPEGHEPGRTESRELDSSPGDRLLPPAMGPWASRFVSLREITKTPLSYGCGGRL